MASFAKVIREDLPAVVQAIASPYSSGVDEGRGAGATPAPKVSGDAITCANGAEDAWLAD